MERALIIRPSSLGDIVHAMPVVHDLRERHPHLAIDWVAEEPFTALVALNRDVADIIPIALRRWRHDLTARATWREVAAFRRLLRTQRYDAILDLQEQVKGALVGAMARGPIYGLDRSSSREPVTTLLYRRAYRVDPEQHLIDRCRQLAGQVFGYEPRGQPHFDLSPPPIIDAPPTQYAIFLHATSRDDKLWPSAHWRALAEHFTQAGLSVLFPWGNDIERARAESLATNISGASVLPKKSLPELAALLAGAEIVCGVDTGLLHLAAALGTPTISVYVATDPRLSGVAHTSAAGRDLGGVGIIPPPADVIAAAGQVLRAFPTC